ncbi:MAG: AAA family ATPase [Sedimentisphaerales bacterium]|nr:AAA family ATPase [Sedimentisphaerales bacterium]
MSDYYQLPSIKIKGYRPFDDITLCFKPLQVIVGANGSGKSSLFEFLRFIRDACYQEIPPEIVGGTIGQQIFHKPGPDKLWWSAQIDLMEKVPLYYQGELMGPVGSTKVIFERVITTTPLHEGFNRGYTFLNFQDGKGVVRDPKDRRFKRKKWDLKKPNQLGLGAITDSTLVTLFNLREYVRGWRFYNSFHINNEKIRKSVPTSQEPVLHEDAGNLSAVLFNLMTEYPQAFSELKSVIKSAIPGFKDLNVKARGGPGEVIAFWQEKAIDMDLSLADLSDGTLRFIAWATLCVMPSSPTLICIDEPDQGVHPRTLPILAGLFEKASQRTQVILATHASYFLSQFDLQNIAVMKKESGKSIFVKVSDSKTLLDNLEDFGRDELEKMHRTDELEALA